LGFASGSTSTAMVRGRQGMLDDPVSDQPYDEAIPVETDDEELVTPPSSDEGDSPPARQPMPKVQASGSGPPRGAVKPQQQARDEDSRSESSGTDASSTSETTEDSKSGVGPALANAYDPEEFKGMKVSADVEELFQYITRYKPQTIELDTSLKPFIPELIPSIGEVDAFLKMPRPDAKPSGLGAARLDEPTLNPSDPSILDLQLRSLSKNRDIEPIEVRCIQNADKFPKEIENWVKNIDDLNRSKPAPTVQYSRRMPDIEQLMQVWPSELEEFLSHNSLPELADLELDLPSYIRIIASILDVPVYSQITETLHVIFTLYSEFKSNQHFSTQNDPYHFGTVPHFSQTGLQATGGPVFRGPSCESMAPSRAPSPVHARGGL